MKGPIVSHIARPAQPFEVRERAICMCEIGSTCTSFEAGHAVHLIQARLASATPTEWVDAIVESVDTEVGITVVRGISDGAARTLWNAAGATDVVGVGEPVAVHARYHVLAVGTQWFNVRSGD